jgi:hypothetical protein
LIAIGQRYDLSLFAGRVFEEMLPDGGCRCTTVRLAVMVGAHRRDIFDLRIQVGVAEKGAAVEEVAAQVANRPVRIP